MRFGNLLIAACLACLYSPVVGQDTLDTPLTRLESIRYDSRFITVQQSWSPETAHISVCRVVDDHAASSNMGTGIHIGPGYVLTARHVIDPGGKVRCEFADGSAVPVSQYFTNREADQALLVLEYAPSVPPAPIATASPKMGERVFMFGFDHGTKFKFYDGQIVNTTGNGGVYWDVNWPSVSGNSGGPVLNERGEVCGNLWGTDDRNTCVVGYPTTVAFFERVGQRFLPFGGVFSGGGQRCAPGQPCPPQGQPAPQPQPQPQTPPYVQPQPAQPTAPACDCDEDALAQRIIDQLKSDESLHGPAGPAGEQGPKGEPGHGVTPEQLGAIAAAITEQLKADPSLRGPQGEPGKDGRDGMDGQPGKDAVISQEQLRQAVADYFAANPQTISLALIDEQGREIDKDTVELGGTLRLQFFEVK